MGLTPSQADDPGWQQLTTLDINPAHHPDVVWDLREKPWPFDDDTFDEVHAYEVLEHLGRQGDAEAFFSDFSEIWRILKPGGHLLGTSPSAGSPWLWGDPGHTRAIIPESFIFLCQDEYENQVGKNAMSDYRYCYSADFKPKMLEVNNGTFSYVLEAIK